MPYVGNQRRLEAEPQLPQRLVSESNAILFEETLRNHSLATDAETSNRNSDNEICEEISPKDPRRRRADCSLKRVIGYKGLYTK